MACSRRCNPRVVTVEPVMFLYAVAFGLLIPTDKSLVYRKVCLSKYTKIICDDISNSTYVTEENSIQQDTSRWEFYVNLSTSVPAIVMTLFYGSFSDKFSRRLPIFLPPIGLILRSIVYLICSVHVDAPVGVLIVGLILNSLSGGIVTMFSTTLSYLMSTVEPENRTFRISLAESAYIIGRMIANFLSGVILTRTSFAFVYCLCIVSACLVFPYGIFWLKEIPSDESDKRDNDQKQTNKTGIENPVYGDEPNEATKQVENNEEPQEETESAHIDGSVHKGNLKLNSKDSKQEYDSPEKPIVGKPTANFKDIFSSISPKRIKETFKVVGRTRSDCSRFYIILLLVGSLCHFMAVVPGYSLFFLFLRHPPLAFGPEMYGYFSGVNSAATGICSLVLIPLLKKRFHLRDLVLVIAGTATHIVGQVWFGLSYVSWMPFVYPVINILGSGNSIILRGLFVSLVENNEMGAILAVFTSLESVAFFLSSLIFNMGLYPATVEYFPGLCFIVGAAVEIVGLIQFVYIFIHKKRKQRKKEQQNVTGDICVDGKDQGNITILRGLPSPEGVGI